MKHNDKNFVDGRGAFKFREELNALNFSITSKTPSRLLIIHLFLASVSKSVAVGRKPPRNLHLIARFWA